MRPFAVAVAAAALAGCGAHATVRGGVVHAEHATYRLGPLGPAWQRHGSDADLAYYDAELDAMIAVDSECPMQHDAPLTVAANTLLIGFTERQTLGEARVALAGREALHRRVRAKLDGVPLVVDAYVLKKDGCLYDLVYLAPVDSADRGAAEFDRFVAGFDTVGGERLARAPGGGGERAERR